jgi:Flp pilus assembly protein TadB
MSGRHARAYLRLPRLPGLAAPGGPARLGGLVGLGGLAGFAGLGGWSGAVLGLLAGLGCAGWLAGRPAPQRRGRERYLAAELPFAVDLVAAALRAGAPPDAATGWVADAVGGVAGEALRDVSHALRRGGTAAEAWALLGVGDAGARVARAAARSAHSGSALAGALGRVADDLRADAVLAAEARARTAGVLIVLPLGLCFLPAFVLTGLVPVIVAVVGGVLTAAPP